MLKTTYIISTKSISSFSTVSHCHFLFYPPHACMHACMRACVRVRLTHPNWSVRFHSTLGVGISGEPSYKTTEAPTASADTSQFHIIQPVWDHTCKHSGQFIWYKTPFVLTRIKQSVAKWTSAADCDSPDYFSHFTACWDTALAPVFTCE